MKPSFILHIDSLCVLEDLTNEQRGELFYAIYSYQTGQEVELSPIIKIAFSQFKNQFDRDNIKYKKTVEARKQAGSKGGKQRVANQANASTTKQNQANQAVSDSKNESVNDSDSVKDSDNKPLATTKSYDDSMRLAIYLLNNILKSNPSHKKPNLDIWAKDIDLAIRIDKRTTIQLKECIDWIYSDSGQFWQKNVLSGSGLRKHFDTMNMQVISKVPTKQEKKLSKQAQVMVKAMKRDNCTDEEIQEALRKIA